MSDQQFQQCDHRSNLQFRQWPGQPFAQPFTYELEQGFEQRLEQAFEHLPFAAEFGQEFERGNVRRQPVLSVWRGRLPKRSTSLSRPGQRPDQRSLQSQTPWPRPVPRPVPRPRPYHGGVWPYGFVVVEPFPAEPFPAEPNPASAYAPTSFSEPFSEPLSEPFSQPGQRDDADVDAGAGAEGEMPASLQDTLARMPASRRPAYLALGSMTQAIADPRSVGPGLYLIAFSSNGQRRAYSGQSDNMRTRLQQHLLCARMLGVSLADHKVYVAPLPAITKDGRRTLEKAIHTDMLARHRGVLTNQRRELELGLLGSAWA